MHSVLEVALPMTTPRIPAPVHPPASPSGEARPVLRAKTIATRVTPEELAEVEAAAEGAGKTVAEWLRELALKAARERPARDFYLADAPRATAEARYRRAASLCGR
jgi:hypothetical protein